MKAVALCVLLGLSTLSTFALDGPQSKKQKGKPPTGGGGDISNPSDVYWQTWGPTECKSLHPGALPSYRGKSVKFRYRLQGLPDGVPPEIKKAQPYHLLADPDNPTRLYSGQELIIELYYKFLGKDKDGNPIPVTKKLPEATTFMNAEVPLISIDIGSSQATALNPAALRQTLGQNTQAFEGTPETDTMYGCSYKQPLVGDTIPTVAVTALVKDVKDPLVLMQTSLPQVHTLSYFNIATGIVSSTIHDKTFSRVESSAASGSTPAQYKTVAQAGDPRVLPVLFFTAYLFRPIDAEVPFEKLDLVPQPSVGFSLSSPSSDFFFGGSSEFFRRNIQLVYGYHYGQTTHLVPGQVDDPSSKDSSQTIKRFDGGAFVGLTFNIDFIKGLFGGGGSKGQ